ncbi:hypothetical protein DL764_000579 [Monosporascus ibericus]|uniref:Amidase domain-containing protein n=1 Tax=Monosporascus ibericus TaxID=155417 RepID=A0A4V1XCQ9_9PEZI|nr:hypothetical protein DL764_000579 [Monosporascus ibericus]
MGYPFGKEFNRRWTTHRLPNGPSKDQNVPKQLQQESLGGWSVYEVTVSELQWHFAERHFTSAEYTQYCLERIRVVNPYVEAVIETNPAALAIAAERDLERRCGQVRGPLHGVPVLVKDNIATMDAMQTTAGSWALLGSVVPQDACVVSSLRVAGAVILGKANMSEWASVRSKAESTGYSARGGQVRNPFDLVKTPHGSSSGSAVAVSANLAPLAIGTETDTSIIGPAATNGIVGIKPTVGLTPRSGVIPISESMDTVGPFGRTVADAAAALDVIAREDDKDPATKVPERRQPGSYLDCLSTAEALRGARFGLPMKRMWEKVSPGCKEVASRVLDAMRAAGAEILEVDFPSVEERVNEKGTWDWEHGDPERSEWTVAKVEAYDGINAYLANLKESPVRSLEDVIQYNRENAGTEGGEPRAHPAFPDGQQTFLEIAEARGVKDDTYHAALRHIRRQTRENGIDAALKGYRGGRGDGGGEPAVTIALDALLFCDRRDIGQQYAAQAGYPIICIPVGVDENGLPVSLSVQHTAWKEAELVKWASAIEDLWNRENGWRATPTYRNLHAKIIPLEGLD